MRIAIVNDRPLAAEALRRAVASVPGYEVAWVAAGGDDAVRRCAADTPDLVLMDLVMPGVDGAEATRRIMAASPCPVLVVTATVSGNYGLACDAMAAGAVDAVATPTLGPDGALTGADPFLAKVAQVMRRSRTLPAAPPPKSRRPMLAAVAASTGGPQATAELLTALGPGSPLAVVLVQHITADFAPGLAEWLSKKTGFPTRVARPGDGPRAGLALLGGSNDHLVLTPDGTLGYTANPTETPFRPSADVLFGSLAANWPQPGLAAVLTGMGRDGADGLLQLRRAGWQTFAQDSASCAVSGMPDAAAKLGAASQVLTPGEIGRAMAGTRR